MGTEYEKEKGSEVRIKKGKHRGGGGYYTYERSISSFSPGRKVESGLLKKGERRYARGGR